MFWAICLSSACIVLTSSHSTGVFDPPRKRMCGCRPAITTTETFKESGAFQFFPPPPLFMSRKSNTWLKGIINISDHCSGGSKMSHWRDYLYCKANPRLNQSKCALRPSWLNWSKCQNKDQRTVFTQKTSPSHLLNAKDKFLHCSESCPIRQEICPEYPLLGFGKGWRGGTVLSAGFSAAPVSP